MKTLEKAMYVDDLAAAADTIGKLENLHKQTTALFDRCSMGFHKWRCSQVELDQELAGADVPADVKVLGDKWSVHTDTLAYGLEIRGQLVGGLVGWPFSI